MNPLRRKVRWLPGNAAQLLENGEAFFPAVFDAIRGAQREVLVETFILFEDKVGVELHAALCDAARRGVQVDLLIDGFGSPDLSERFIQELARAGVHLRTFDPGPRWFGLRLNVLRRMHRKIVVVDGERAFIGGINYSADHLADYGPEAKQDYAVELRGPIADEIRAFALRAIRNPRPALRAQPPQAGPAQAMLVTRDNLRHRNDIERHYRIAIRAARKRVLIANAYFFPGWRMLHELRRAARRGVDVQLILQGQPDVPLARRAASLLYEHLIADGVTIHEYCKRPLHGKVAVVDDDWATVGSSNLDPLSLSLNLEANVVLRDAGFADHLAGRLQHLIEHACRRVEAPPAAPGWRLWNQLRATLVFHFMRSFPAWADWLPRHAPRLKLFKRRPPAAETAPDATVDHAR